MRRSILLLGALLLFAASGATAAKSTTYELEFDTHQYLLTHEHIRSTGTDADDFRTALDALGDGDGTVTQQERTQFEYYLQTQGESALRPRINGAAPSSSVHDARVTDGCVGPVVSGVACGAHGNWTYATGLGPEASFALTNGRGPASTSGITLDLMDAPESWRILRAQGFQDVGGVATRNLTGTLAAGATFSVDIGPWMDADGDGVSDVADACPGHDDGADADNDGVPDGCDDGSTSPCAPPCTNTTSTTASNTASDTTTSTAATTSPTPPTGSTTTTQRSTPAPGLLVLLGSAVVVTWLRRGRAE